jgi:dipeptidyl aminopeptidase/acylaminoacyl peptidase
LREVGTLDVVPHPHAIEWLADSRSLLVSVTPRGVTRAQLAQQRERAQPSAPGSGVTARVYSFDPAVAGAVPQTEQSNLDLTRRGLVRVDIASGKVHWVVPDARVPAYLLSPDRGILAYTRILGTDKPGSQQFVLDLVTYDFGSDTTRVLSSKVYGSSFNWNPTWSPRGDALAYRTVGPAATDEVFLVPLSGAPRRIAEGRPKGEYGARTDVPVWDGDGRYVYFMRGNNVWRAAADGSGAAEFARSPDRELELAATPAGQLFSNDGGRTFIARTLHTVTKQAGFARIDPATGAITPLVEQDTRHGGYSVPLVVSRDKRHLAFVSENANSPAEWWMLGADGQPRQVSRVSTKAFADRSWGSVRVIEWTTIDGDKLRGALLLPANYQAGRRYPLVVKVYGGSLLSNSRNRFGLGSTPIDNEQIYATRGYAVLLADSKVKMGSPMVDLLKSVIPGVDKAIEVGVADPERIGITGHSYGGYSTLALITQSPRFAAAVMSAGIGNLVSAYGQLSKDGTNYLLPWAEEGQGRMGGTPWEHRSRYIENSPSFYLDRVRTPLLIVHGAEDTACSPFLAEEVFVGLRRLGQTVTYALYEGEEHWPGTWSYENQVDVVNRTLAWFDRYLKNKPARARTENNR